MTRHQELIEYGRDVRKRWDGGWLVDGRPVRMLEMMALITLARHERQLLADREGCCCADGPFDDGRCRHGLPRCPAAERAKDILRRYDHEH